MIPSTDPPCVFALGATREFGEQVSRHLGIALAQHEERGFEDGEHKARPLLSVRDRDVFVIQSLHGGPEESVNDKLCRLLFFIGALRDAAAARITALVPYLGYARKDRKTKLRDPVTTRYVAALFEAVGTDRVVTLDVHNLAAYQNAFRCRTEHLEAHSLFVEWCAEVLDGAAVAVVSPDIGGVKRADRFREQLAARLGSVVTSAFLEKHRSSGVVRGDIFAGEVRDRVAVIVDDLISTGTTILRAAEACREHGAQRVYAIASHGVLMPDAERMLAHPALAGVVVTDTIPPFRVDSKLVSSRLTVLSVAPLFAAAIRRLHTGGSLAELD